MTESKTTTFDKITHESIVSMLHFKDYVLVATPHQIFRLKDGKFDPLKFEYAKEDENDPF